MQRHLSTASTASASSPSAAAPTPSPPAYHLLHYRYVDNMLERRTPVRPLHLAHAAPYVQRGQLLLGGACPPAIKQALLVFRGLDRAGVGEFARKDPYVTNGLVEEWSVQDWAVVLGSAM